MNKLIPGSQWDLLPELADRLVFGVSVFHAYGHQWACQIVFHPRKRVGFGLTDGEGCERFWSAIRHLIPGLRVSGFYRRLFILDRQMRALNDASLWKIGVWLRRKHGEAVRRLAEARIALASCGVDEQELRAQWAAQVKAQVQKPPRASGATADKTIDEILVLMGLVGDLKQQIRDDRAKLRKAHAMTSPERQKLQESIDGATRDIESTESRIASLHETLGTERARRLEKLRGDAYIRARVKARALRAAIRDHLVHHKFEHRKLERAFRHQARLTKFTEAKEHAQTKDLVHRRERTIGAQVRSFNKLVDEMALLAKQGKKPPGRSPLPRKLDTKKLFKLDVDDDIWQEDPGLGPQGEGDLPRWQTDDDVKRGILAFLQADRCREQMERLDSELIALATWWKERLDAMKALLVGSGALGKFAARFSWIFS
ncbi:hypothetical protein AURDEDRAFT_69821 [Auricularia subglabra TFB-10046 SS5]|nr:hypothetical protein AURDEDRAFT_69821 [Auricularia subglabra TFB-10046 SS5]